MKNVQLAIALIGTGLSIAFISLGYVHGAFANKETVNKIEQEMKGVATKSDVVRLEKKIDNIQDYLLQKGR